MQKQKKESLEAIRQSVDANINFYNDAVRLKSTVDKIVGDAPDDVEMANVKKYIDRIMDIVDNNDESKLPLESRINHMHLLSNMVQTLKEQSHIKEETEFDTVRFRLVRSYDSSPFIASKLDDALDKAEQLGFKLHKMNFNPNDIHHPDEDGEPRLLRSIALSLDYENAGKPEKSVFDIRLEQGMLKINHPLTGDVAFEVNHESYVNHGESGKLLSILTGMKILNNTIQNELNNYNSSSENAISERVDVILNKLNKVPGLEIASIQNQRSIDSEYENI